jgi:polysaccharide export outer membrane protein
MFKISKIFFLVLFLSTGIFSFVYSQDKKEEDAKDLYRLGNIYYQQGRYKEAEEMFRQALDLVKEKETPELSARQTKPESKETKVSEAGVQQKPALPAATTEYLIGEDDALKISVWQNPDLDQEVIVRPDGKISFPLIGDVQASGLSITQLDNEITDNLKEYVKFPEVSISITKIGGSRVVILGQVSTPGVYSVAGKKTIAEALGMAGGFTRDAVPSSTILIRGGLNAPNAQRINLSKLFKGDLGQNVVLQSQDIIFVPRKFISDLNYFLTQIIDPIAKGAYTNRELKSW